MTSVAMRNIAGRSAPSVRPAVLFNRQGLRMKAPCRHNSPPTPDAPDTQPPQAEATPPFPPPAARSGSRRPRVVIADDHVLLRDTLVPLIEEEFEVVGCVGDGAALVEAAVALEPDLALIDIGMPIMGGLEAGRELHRLRPAIRLVYMTSDESLDVAAEAFELGASGYLLKTGPASELIGALRIIAAGGTYLTEAVAGGRVPDLLAADAGPTTRLSPREYAVLQLAVTGAPMKEIARQLGISPRTVAFHKYRGMAALGLHRQSELVEFALAHGMLRTRAPGR